MNHPHSKEAPIRPLRNVDLCRQVNALCNQSPFVAPPIFPDADAVPAARSADAGLRHLFRRPVTVPWLAKSDAYRSLTE